MSTNVYVDCFNLYYGCLRDTPYRWLNIADLVRQELPGSSIHQIRCFLAQVKARPTDLNLPVRQQTYMRALRTIPNLTIHLGQFLETKPWMLLATPPPPPADAMAKVIKTEEKGSDVNLACHLLLDVFRGACAKAVVITNDSDLCEPIRIATQEFNVPVTVLHPMRPGRNGQPARRPSNALKNVASHSKAIQTASLAAAQFPPTLTDQHGTITKPAAWDAHLHCKRCLCVYTSTAWHQPPLGLQCPGCSYTEMHAWSVLRLNYPHYPEVPLDGSMHTL